MVGLASKFIANPLAPKPSSGDAVVRLVGVQAQGHSIHDDVKPSERISLSIEFGVMHDGGNRFVPTRSYSHHMTADVLGLQEGAAGNLTLGKAKAIIQSFEMGNAFKS